ncbi:MAG: hypothetical protein SNH73_04205 [Rikenellaceae bacterium]
MKFLKLLSILSSAALLFVGCNSEEESSSDSTDYALWQTSIGIDSTGVIPVIVGSTVTFSDLSMGEVTHEWRIDSSCHFTGDSSGATESYEPIAAVVFDNVGEYDVTLYNTYASNVTDSSASITAVKEDGAWVVEKSFTVKVFENIQPALSIKKVTSEGATEDIVTLAAGYEVPTNPVSWTQVYVNNGDSLQFTNESVGDPDEWSITVDDKTYEGSGSTISVPFDTNGTFSSFEISISRNSPSSIAARSIPLIASVGAFSDEPEEELDGVSVLTTIDQQSVFGFEYAYNTTYYWRTDSYFTIDNSIVAAGLGSLKAYAEADVASTKCFIQNINYVPFLEAGTYLFAYKMYIKDTGVDLTDVPIYNISHKLNTTAGDDSSSTWKALPGEDGVTPTSLPHPEERDQWVRMEHKVIIEEGIFNEGITRFRVEFLSGVPMGTEVYFDSFDIRKLD